MNSYRELLNDVLTNGESHNDRTTVGTISVFGRQWRHDMRSGFPLLTTKKVPLRWVFEELRWFLSGSTDRQQLTSVGVDIWNEWNGPDKNNPNDMGPIYGYQWRNFGGVDQIATLLHDILLSPNSRRLMVTAWCPPDLKFMALPPCHYGFQIKCYEEHRQMSLHMTMRSTDIFLGLPFNIASYALLLTMLAKVTDYEPRELIISFGDLHLYNNHVEQAKLQLSRTPFALPNVSLHNTSLERDNTSLEQLLSITWDDITLTDYKYHSKIEAPVAI